MIRTGQEYLDSIRDAREVYINGERVTVLAEHPMFKPLIDIRARIYDMQHGSATRDLLAYREDGKEEWNAIANKLPRTQDDWWAKRRATDTILETIGGIVTRVGSGTARVGRCVRRRSAWLPPVRHARVACRAGS